MNLHNIEFYSTPDGDIMMKPAGEAVRVLSMNYRSMIEELLSVIKSRYPIAFKRLSEVYTRNERNRFLFEYNMVHRFLRCNCGEYDQNKYDIDNDGRFYFEEVRCPLRGTDDCKDEGTICKPSIDSRLSEREKQILGMIAGGLHTQEIANDLGLSATTVNRHRENIKAKSGARNIADLVNYHKAICNE